MLIEDLYDNLVIDIKEVVNKKISGYSLFEKTVLGIKDYKGYQEQNIFDVAFMNRVPFQIMFCRYKFLKHIGRERFRQLCFCG